MDWFPELNLVLYGGWMPLGFALAVEGLSLLAMPRSVKSRLFERHDWSKKQRTFLLGGKLFSLACLVVIILSPMNMASIPFILGLMLYTVALPCLVLSLLNYKDAPSGKPATKGLFELSRNPQIVSNHHRPGDRPDDPFPSGDLGITGLEGTAASNDPGGGRSLPQTVR